MAIEKQLDYILDSKSKIKILRLFISKGDSFLASGNDIAKLVGFTPPAVHASLKELYGQNILHRDIVGKQHIYRLNISSRTVKDILIPLFCKERSVKEDIKKFLLDKITVYNIRNSILSMILYGSLSRGQTHEASDCDVAVVVKDFQAKNKVEDLFMDTISCEFSEHFGFSLDTYIKTADEFRARLKKHLAPVSTLMKSYVVLYGKDPLDYR